MSRMSAVRLARARARFPPCENRVHPSLFIPHLSLTPFLSSSLYLCGDLRLSNRGIYHVPLTAGTAGAVAGCVIRRAQANICAERSDGKWCCKRRAWDICQTLDMSTCPTACAHKRTGLRLAVLRHGDTHQTQRRRLWILSHAINHPSSNCPRLP